MSKQRGILVAEDDADDLFFIRRALSRVGLIGETTFVKDGRSVIEYLSGASPYENRELYPLPKLILLDLVMPGASGLEVLQWVSGHPSLKQIPVVIFTGSEAPGQIQRALALGARRCWIKTTEVNQWGDNIYHLAKEFGLFPEFSVPAQSHLLEVQKAA